LRAIVLFLPPAFGKSQHLDMMKVEQCFISDFLSLSGNFAFDLKLPFDHIDDELFQIVNLDHSSSFWIVFLPHQSELLDSFRLNLLLFVTQLLREGLENNCYKQVHQDEGHIKLK
jgi:hypothetical protein